MNLRRITLLACMAFAMVALAAPAGASAFRLVKSAGGFITKHTEIHFTDDLEVNGANSSFKCEVNGTLTTKDGEEATTVVTNLSMITNSCVGGGFYKNCKVSKDTITLPGKGAVAIDENAFTFELEVRVDFAAGCPFTFAVGRFKPLKIHVGLSSITVGLIEGKGEIEDDVGMFEAIAAGEMTLGQYTEEGVNQGSAKGVFKIK